MGDQPYVGEIAMFAGNYAPVGWMFCDGSELPIRDYQALFSLLSTTYGGNGTTTFKLPDLRGRLPMGFGSAPGLTPRQIGASGGAEKVALGPNEMPVHNHPAKLNALQDAGQLETAKKGYIASHANAFQKNGTVIQMSDGSVTVDNAGSGAQHENMPPFLAINYIIAYDGIYPPRP